MTKHDEIADPIHVDFWFDPGCPFTWRTSRWLLDVAGQRPLDISWRLMSLTALNEGKEMPEAFAEPMRQSARARRVLAAALDAGGQDALAAAYSSIGTAKHYEGADYDDATLRAGLTAAGLPPTLVSAADDETYDKAIRISHDEGQARVGSGSGSPITAIDDGTAYFGPVVVPVPQGDDALRLFDGIRLMGSVPAFSELKGARASF